MPQPDPLDWIPAFIGALKAASRRDDRASLAVLRRGLGKPVGHAGQRDVWVYQHLRGAAPDHEDAAALVASLFAVHPADAGLSVGSAFRRLFLDQNESASIEKRFANLIDADAEDLPARMRQAVSLLKSKDIPLDYRRLLEDLLGWDHPKRPVQRRWTREFWASRAAPARPSDGAAAAVNSANESVSSSETTEEGELFE